MTFKQRSQLGFLLPAAIFLLVILAGLGAYAVNINSVQQQSGVQDIQSARVYHRARALLEYAIYQVLTADTSTNLPTCPSITNLNISNLDGLSTSTHNISCTSQDYGIDGGDSILRVYNIQSKVSSGTLNTSNYIERQIDLTISNSMPSDLPPSDSIDCASEGGVCSIVGANPAVIWYGSNSSWYFKIGISGSINCNNATFGDPIFGTVKSCKYKILN
jgi:MSHA biogenesis protein MshP